MEIKARVVSKTVTKNGVYAKIHVQKMPKGRGFQTFFDVLDDDNFAIGTLLTVELRPRVADLPEPKTIDWADCFEVGKPQPEHDANEIIQDLIEPTAEDYLDAYNSGHPILEASVEYHVPFPAHVGQKVVIIPTEGVVPTEVEIREPVKYGIFFSVSDDDDPDSNTRSVKYFESFDSEEQAKQFLLAKDQTGPFYVVKAI